MSDPLGIIGGLNQAQRAVTAPLQSGRDQRSDGLDFKQLLREQIAQVNRLQGDATVAVEDLATGRRDDVEGVMIATIQADTAFRMLLQVRNKVMEAYEEIKQIRV